MSEFKKNISLFVTVNKGVTTEYVARNVNHVKWYIDSLTTKSLLSDALGVKSITLNIVIHMQNDDNDSQNSTDEQEEIHS